MANLARQVEKAVRDHGAVDRIAAAAAGQHLGVDERAGGEIALFDAPLPRRFAGEIDERAVDRGAERGLWTAADVRKVSTTE
jgi:hypothetical protein